VNKFLEVLAGLIGLLVSAKKKQEEKEAQSEANHVSDNPSDWFADHFRVPAGVTRESNGETSEADADGSLRGRR
jgi:hypothetical protein